MREHDQPLLAEVLLASSSRANSLQQMTPERKQHWPHFVLDESLQPHSDPDELTVRCLSRVLHVVVAHHEADALRGRTFRSHRSRAIVADRSCL